MRQLSALRGYKHLTCIVYKTSTEKGIVCAPLMHRVRHALSGMLLSPAGKTHLNDLEKRSERSRRTSPPFSWQSRIPHRLRTHLPLLTLFIYMFSSIPYTAELGPFVADSLTAMIINSHWASTTRMRSVRLGLLWVKDGEEVDGAPLNWSFQIRWLHQGPQKAHLGTSGLGAQCVSAIWWFLLWTLRKPIFRFSALIGCDAPQWFYNMRWPHTWDH